MYCVRDYVVCSTLMRLMSSHSSVFMVFFFKQKTAYEMRISDWSSDVCSSDLTEFPNFASICGRAEFRGRERSRFNRRRMCGSAALKAFNSLHQVLDLASARARSSSRLRLRLHLRYSSGLGFFRCCRTGEDQIMRAETCQRPAGERPHVRSVPQDAAPDRRQISHDFRPEAIAQLRPCHGGCTN